MISVCHLLYLSSQECQCFSNLLLNEFSDFAVIMSSGLYSDCLNSRDMLFFIAAVNSLMLKTVFSILSNSSLSSLIDFRVDRSEDIELLNSVVYNHCDSFMIYSTFLPRDATQSAVLLRQIVRP